MENLESILEEVDGFVEIPVNPKAQPLTSEEIERMAAARKARAEARVKADLEEVESDTRNCRKADFRFAGRALSGIAIGAGAFVAQAAGLMDPRLAIGVGGVALALAAFWTGAWLQFRFCDGLLEF